jgi:YesN/AraC family two-component response regulator
MDRLIWVTGFLVEDEIVTREGIRDNMNWKAGGFELCGEVPDGEIALPSIQESKLLFLHSYSLLC